MVDTFIERGFTYFDTAWMYCAFKSEKRREGSTCFLAIRATASR